MFNICVDSCKVNWKVFFFFYKKIRQKIIKLFYKRGDEVNAVENIERLVKEYFEEKVEISDKTVTNNCIGALVNENNYDEFKRNFEERLSRISSKITDSSQRENVVDKIKNLAEEKGYKWSGPYSELVALDFFLSSDYIAEPCFINCFESSRYPESLPARNKRKTIDIDFSFEFKTNKFYTDVKSLIPMQIEIFDTIIDNVIKEIPNKRILIGVDDLKPESMIDFQKVVQNEKAAIERELLKGIQSSKNKVIYTSQEGIQYVFRISYNGILTTMHSKSPYELARFDKYKYLNYYNKLLDTDYTLLTFVLNPWFNRQIDDFACFNEIYYRSVCRRVFMEFKDDKTPANTLFKSIKDITITISDISRNIAGILFIEDKSVKKDDDGLLYKAYLYLNPNYKNKDSLKEHDFSSAFDYSSFAKMMKIDDFQDDNY